MTKAYALLRAGYPYLTTYGMRRVTTFASDIAFGGEGRMYVVSRGEYGPNIRKLNQQDEDLGTIDGPFTWPTCIATDAAENVYVSDEGAHNISVFNRQGELQRKFGEFGSDPGQFNRPSGLAFDREGTLYVSDTQNHRIQRFTKDGEFIACWGAHGDAPGEFAMPWGITVDDGGDVYVADWRNDRVQRCDANGRFIMSVGRSGTGNGEFTRPSGVAVDEHGDIIVADRGNNRVQLFDHRGRYVEKFTGDATISRMGRVYILANHKTLRLREMTELEPQKLFRAPTSVRLGPNGDLYVCDQASHRVQVYRKEAYVLAQDQILPEMSAPTLMTT
ncbi:MAG: NHL repeat-containing protein [Dehalococcoidia bacterium]